MTRTEGLRLTDPVTCLKGIGPKKAEALAEGGVKTVEDLLRRYPKKYEDRRHVTAVSALRAGESFLIEARVVSRRFSGFRYGRKSPLSLLLEDETGRCEAVFFNGAYLANSFNIGSSYSFFGKVSENQGRLQFIHPEFHRLGDPQDVRGILPVYGACGPLSGTEFRRWVRQALDQCADLEEEWLPPGMAETYNLADPAFAIRNIHFPETPHHVLSSRYRFIFEELFCLSAGLLYVRRGNKTAGEGVRLDPGLAAPFQDALPFTLTTGQARVWAEVSRDLASSSPMNRLVQGDVGSGKTAVAELAMFTAARSGFQSVMMAPTEILAKQHYGDLSRAFEPFGIRVGLLCGSLKAKEREEVLGDLAAGRIQVLVGTHALIQPDVAFRALGLVVTDEQHRFGVEQRRLLSEKGAGPNVMVMTATPIPRTLAVILYGDLDISVIDTMPEGRKPIETRAVAAADRMKVYRFLAEEVGAGRQAYVVAPLIEASDAIDARSAEEIYEELRKKFPEIRTALLHGAMKQEEKARVMEQFVRGEIQVLVSTVVIEVGINVPNATVMVIENCERFGLAQMHQLRGRVGRGGGQSYCFLILHQETEIARERAEILCSSTDGFRIAEEDLRLRGPGEMFGTRQHGLPELALSDLARHTEVLSRAKEAAQEVLERDPGLRAPEDAEVRAHIEKLFHGEIRIDM